MPFVLKSATPEDVANSARFYSDATTGDLLSPALPYFWPIDDSDEAALKTRAAWCAKQQKDLLEHDSTAHFIQVVDEETNEPVGFGRWHEYPNGPQRDGYWEAVGSLDPSSAATWPSGLNKKLWLRLWDETLDGRNEWFQPGPAWVLTTVCTRRPFRGKGVASMILEWGLARAKTAGSPAYLESVPEAKAIYERHGFRQVGTHMVEAEVGTVEIARMRAF